MTKTAEAQHRTHECSPVLMKAGFQHGASWCWCVAQVHDLPMLTMLWCVHAGRNDRLVGGDHSHPGVHPGEAWGLGVLAVSRVFRLGLCLRGSGVCALDTSIWGDS